MDRIREGYKTYDDGREAVVRLKARLDERVRNGWTVISREVFVKHFDFTVSEEGEDTAFATVVVSELDVAKVWRAGSQPLTLSDDEWAPKYQYAVTMEYGGGGPAWRTTPDYQRGAKDCRKDFGIPEDYMVVRLYRNYTKALTWVVNSINEDDAFDGGFFS